MKKSKNIILCLVILVLVSCYVTFVQDYKIANGEKVAKTDKLCGLLITHGTRENYIDSKINWNELNKADITIDNKGNLEVKEGGLNSLFTSKVEGKLVQEKTLTFPGVKGYFFGIIPLEKDGEVVKGILADDEINNVSLSVNVTDQGEENTGEGTLRVIVEKEELFNANPVYLRNDGSYYVMLGVNPGLIVTSSNSGGSRYSMVTNNTSSSIQGYTTNSNNDTYKINILVVDQVQNVYIKEMNDKDELLNITEFKRKDDKEFVLQSDTAYVIVEEVFVDKENENYRLRSTYNFNSKDKDNLQTHLCNFPGDDKVISGVAIQFIQK